MWFKILRSVWFLRSQIVCYNSSLYSLKIIYKTKSETRERYDRVLVEGLPNRMVRKMMKLSSFEVAVLLIITATTIHYCTMWGSYWEKKMILNDHIDAVSKRKKQKAAVEHLTAAKDQIEYPSFRNLLPFLVIKGIFYFFMAIPAAIKAYNDGKSN